MITYLNAYLVSRLFVLGMGYLTFVSYQQNPDNLILQIGILLGLIGILQIQSKLLKQYCNSIKNNF